MEKIIEGFPEYAAHADGYVVSLKHGMRRRLIGGSTLAGYRSVSLRHAGKQAQKLTHRLVAEAFLPNPEQLPQVNHIDGDKKNNAVTNLEWVTPSQNMKHAYAIGHWGNQHTGRVL